MGQAVCKGWCLDGPAPGSRMVAHSRARDQTAHPALARRVPRKGQSKGPRVLVGRGVQALHRTLPGCSVSSFCVAAHVA